MDAIRHVDCTMVDDGCGAQHTQLVMLVTRLAFVLHSSQTLLLLLLIGGRTQAHDVPEGGVVVLPLDNIQLIQFISLIDIDGDGMAGGMGPL